MRKLAIILSLLALIALLIGCSKKPNDDTITKDIQSKVAANPMTQDSPVIVQSKEGKVTLTGKAKTPAARQEVVKMAKEEPGVWTVDDQMSVEPKEKASAPAQPTEPVGRLTPAATPPPPPPAPVIVPAGTVLTIRTSQAISSKTAQPGTVFAGSMMTPITHEGKTLIPAGADVTGIVKDAKKAGKFKGGATLVLHLNAIVIKGHHYNIETEFVEQTTTGKGKRTAGVVAGGTGVGAAIGGIAGGGKGAAIGAITGAAAGTIGAATTGGNRNIELPAESALSFKLMQPLTLKAEGQKEAVGE